MPRRNTPTARPSSAATPSAARLAAQSARTRPSSSARGSPCACARGSPRTPPCPRRHSAPAISLLCSRPISPIPSPSRFTTGPPASRSHKMEVTESASQQNTAKLLGLNGVCDLSACWHAPYFTVTNFSTLGNPNGATQGQGVSGPRGWKNEIFQINSSLSLVRGRHVIRVGFTGNRYRDTFVEAYYPAGQHNFNGQWTTGPGSSGFAFADVLLGLPREILAGLDIFDLNYRNSHVMPWVQDDWKITP